MSVFDKIKNDWIQVRDDLNKFTIENFDYATGVIQEKVGNHCVKCTSANMCWFKNEPNKKPEKFLTFNNDIVTKIVNGLTPGLYHFYCHCQEIPIEKPNIYDIKSIIDIGKINWLIKDKNNWLQSMGYNDLEKFLSILEKCLKESYCNGNYTIIDHSQYGCKANFFLNFPGTNEKFGKIYTIKSAFMIFPNGKLKCNTLIGGWYNEISR